MSTSPHPMVEGIKMVFGKSVVGILIVCLKCGVKDICRGYGDEWSVKYHPSVCSKIYEI